MNELEDKQEGNEKLVQDAIKDFEDAIAKRKDNLPVAIFSHAYVDPDAIGSMIGLAWLLEMVYNIDSVCFFDGDVSHPQNNAMVNLLDPPIRPIQEYNSSDYGLHIVCDTIPSHAGIGKNNINFDLVIDHHKEPPNGGFQGTYINLKAGSASATLFAIMQKLCKLKNIWFDSDSERDQKVCTSLLVGIMTDTEGLLSQDATSYDIDAFYNLFEYRIPEALHQIIFFKRPKFWIDTKAAASGNAVCENGTTVVGLGLIPNKSRDILADLASELKRWQGTDLSIVFGLVGGDRIEGCVRSVNYSSLSVSDLCKKLGGRHGQGGGKLCAGSYSIPLAGFEIDPDDDEETKLEAWNVINKKEIKRILRIVKNK